MSLIILGHWQLTMYVHVRSVDHPVCPPFPSDPAPGARSARRALHHQAAAADQARWWTDAYLSSRLSTLR